MRPLADAGVPSYRTTLNQRDKVTDDEERDTLLTTCHKRCAERTLRVLEKNGGIFIKLGQHLVGDLILKPTWLHSRLLTTRGRVP